MARAAGSGGHRRKRTSQRRRWCRWCRVARGADEHRHEPHLPARRHRSRRRQKNLHLLKQSSGLRAGRQRRRLRRIHRRYQEKSQGMIKINKCKKFFFLTIENKERTTLKVDTVPLLYCGAGSVRDQFKVASGRLQSCLSHDMDIHAPKLPKFSQPQRQYNSLQQLQYSTHHTRQQ